VAGSELVPRLLRAALLRFAGIQVKTANIMPGCTFANQDVEIGPGTFVNRECFFEGPLKIGSGCIIGPRVCIVASTHPWAETEGFERVAVPKPVVIEPDCWIGARVTIVAGVRIGRGVTVAAGAVVVRDCEEGMLYAGVPARAVRKAGPSNRSMPADQ